MWREHYGTLFNSVESNVQEGDVRRDLDNISLNVDQFTTEDVREIIKSLSVSKAGGSDGLVAEHLKHASDRISAILSLCFNACLIHGHIPCDLIHTVLVPVLKNKSGDVTDKGNYRPIALSSIVSKVLERLILDRCEDFLVTSDFQFGFKAKHSTDLCIYALKEVLDYFKSHSSPIFLCFMDASCAFDRINHWKLFRQLLDRDMPVILVRLLLVWYREQTASVRWGSSHSDTFSVCNGVRQGGILSPRLFNVYMDKLSILLSDIPSGCTMGNRVLNHFMYADDLVLISPSIKGLQKLVTVCEHYGTEFDILYNSRKTVVMNVFPRNFKLLNSPQVILCGRTIQVVSDYKYLGYIMVSDMNDDKAMLKQIRAFYARSNYLLKHFANCSIDVKLQLFKAFCSNMYCAHLWSSFKICTFNKLRVSFNNVFRRFMLLPKFCSASQMFAFSHVMSFNELWRKSIFNFRTRIYKCTNSVVVDIFNVTYFTSKLYTHWNTMLYI